MPWRPPPGGSPRSHGAVEGIPKAIKAADLTLPAIRRYCAETLGYIFEAIFETWISPDTVKTAIAACRYRCSSSSLFDQALSRTISTCPALINAGALHRSAAGYQPR